METISTSTLIELISLSNDLALTNATYLVICVTILLSAGGFHYLFNIKPLQEKLEKQENELKRLTENLNKKIEDIQPLIGYGDTPPSGNYPEGKMYYKIKDDKPNQKNQ